MIYNENDREIKWLWIDGKQHTIKIVNGDEEVNIDDILSAAKKAIDDKKEMCENIHYLGVGLTGDSKTAYGFLLGWLFRSVKQALEKGESKWRIEHTSKEMSEEEQIDDTIKTLDFLKQQLQDKKMSLKDLPSIGGNANGPTEMFS
jgi:hypothetical protein